MPGRGDLIHLEMVPTLAHITQCLPGHRSALGRFGDTRLRTLHITVTPIPLLRHDGVSGDHRANVMLCAPVNHKEVEVVAEV